MAASKAAVLLVLYHLVKLLYCAEYHVKADPPSTCPTNATFCLTLSEYLQNSTRYFTSGSTFTLLQGQHHLNQTLALSDVTNITFRGLDPDMTTLSIAENGSITWNNTQNIEINSLNVNYTGGNLLNVNYAGGSETLPAALIFQGSTLQATKVQFTGKKKNSSGIQLMHSNVCFINCSFTQGQNSIGVYAHNSKVEFLKSTVIRHNIAGSVIVARNLAVMTFSGISIFQENRANLLNIVNSSLVLKGSTTFKLNILSQEAVYVFQSSLTILNRALFSENAGICIYGNVSNITLDGWLTFSNNYLTGWLNRYTVTCIGMRDFISTTVYSCNSTLWLKGEVTFMSNKAEEQGGALVLHHSQVNCEGDNILNFINNSANRGSGGAIYSNTSTIYCSGNISFINNSADEKGGGLYAINSILNISGSWSFQENTAVDGGGMALESTQLLLLHSPITMNFDGNRAISKGGGILFILNNCMIKYEICFFNIEVQNISFPTNVQLNFANNFAGLSGSVLYGGSLETCYIDMKNKVRPNTSLIFNISSNMKETVSRISSDPVQLCFCNSNNMPDDLYKVTSISRGKKFNLPVIAFDQGRKAVPSTVHAYIKIQKSTTQLIQNIRTIEGECTNITFQLFTEDEYAELILLPLNTPCGNTDNAKAISYVLLTSCPPGFTLTGNRCSCNFNIVSNLQIVRCDNDNLKIVRLGNSWIDEIRNESTGSILCFVYHHNCPVNYCKPESENNNIIYFSPNFTSDVQCSSNRSGMLCGACKDGFSLTLHTFKCRKCGNRYIALLLLFAFAGVAVIAVLLALHMTVAAGTINGLILYANIVNVNIMVFLPQNSTNILTVFLLWLNFDFGIETCFYNGLNSYSYAWLQYVFPLYLWFLIGLIIISSKYSAKIRKLFGSNPVAVLATVILMSYTKLLQAITQSLPYTVMEYSDGYMKKVWRSDPNVTYFGYKHAFLVLTALCTLFFLLVPYTFLLFFGYHLQAFSTKRAFSWLNKIKPVLDVYYAPYRANTRYWPGLMLLVRGCLYIIIYMVSNPTFNLLFISFVLTAVALISWLRYRVYEKLYNDILEASFILNICLLSAVSYHVQAVDGNQKLVTHLSISIAFLQFLGIVTFHLFLRIKHIKLLELFRNGLTKKFLPHPEEVQEEKPADVQAVSMTVMDLREPLLESQQQ